MPSHSLFFALLPDASGGEAAHRLACGQRSHLGWPRPRQTLHVTLAGVAWRRAEPPSAAVVTQSRAVGERVRFPRFRVRLERLESWTRRRPEGPAVLVGEEGVLGVDLLHAQIAMALGRTPDPGFNPHMSIAWGGGPFAPAYVEPLDWTVREFVLAHSLVGLGRYEILARFPLG